jgi:hypothetical protein
MQRSSDDALRTIVNAYFQSASSGFPYINCPNELKPAAAFPDTWWVIYAPNFQGGFVIEGYHIEEWRHRFSTYLLLLGISALVFWYFGGMYLYIYLMDAIGWWVVPLAAVGVPAVLFAAGRIFSWIFVRPVLKRSEWREFPDSLQRALAGEDARIANDQQKVLGRNIFTMAVTRTLGFAGGQMVGAVAGHAAEKLSESVIELLAERAIQKVQKD